MRILVTGGAGFLGRHVAHALATRGDDLTILDDLSCPNSTFEAPELQLPGIECIRGSTLDLPLVRRLVQNHEVVFHLASVVGVEETIQRPFETMRNLEGTLNVVEALRPAQVVLFTSSADVYGLHSHLYDRPMHEDDRQLFESSAVNRWVYPKIKSLEENAVLHGPGRGIVVRVFNCFGPGMDFPHGKRVVPQFIERILARQPLRVSGTGEQRRALCYYTDTIRGLLLAMRYLVDDPDAPPATVNIGSAETWTMLGLAETLIEIALDMRLLDAPLPIERHATLYSQAFDDSWHRTPDLQRAREMLGYEPRIPARDGLRRTLEHYAVLRRRVAPRERPAAAAVVPRPRRADTHRETDILILGGGIAGLSCRAAIAGDRDTLLLEAEDEIGGLLRVFRRGDFTFDTTVHAVSFQNPRLRRFFEGLLPAGFHAFEKQNLIWQAGRTIDYPYQFHLHQLPPEIRQECAASVPVHPGRGLAPDCSFEAWLLGQFGRGLYQHFFAPYNAKLYGVHPSELEAAPMVWTIPVDHRAASLASATVEQRAAKFLYPRGSEGISALVRAMAECSTAPMLCGERVVAVDPGRRVIETERGLQVHYRELVSSLPLPQLIGMCLDASPSLRACAALLEAAAVTVVEIGVREHRPALHAHWTYFPEAEIPFYRMTRLERMSPDLCPAGATALLLECPGRAAPDRARVLATLLELGVLSSPDVEWYGTRCIPNAYVLFRPGTRGIVATLGDALQVRGIQSIGRFGEWSYSNIEQCVLAGLEAARALARQDEESKLLRQLRAEAQA